MLSFPDPFLINWGRRRAGKLLRSDRLLKLGHDFHLVVSVKLLHRNVEGTALLAFDKQLGYFRTPLQILGKDFSDGPLAWFAFALGIRAERVTRELASVLLFSDSRLLVPDLTLFFGQVLPGQSDDLGQRTVVGLYLGGDMLTADK